MYPETFLRYNVLTTFSCRSHNFRANVQHNNASFVLFSFVCVVIVCVRIDVSFAASATRRTQYKKNIRNSSFSRETLTSSACYSVTCVWRTQIAMIVIDYSKLQLTIISTAIFCRFRRGLPSLCNFMCENKYLKIEMFLSKVSMLSL